MVTLTAGVTVHELSQEIWNHPEENFQEVRAHGVLTDFLESRGLTVERNYIVDTGFKCVVGSSDDGPHVAILCEYDALPVIGHGCGHNLIAEVGIGAGLGVISAFRDNGKPLGKVGFLTFAPSYLYSTCIRVWYWYLFLKTLPLPNATEVEFTIHCQTRLQSKFNGTVDACLFLIVIRDANLCSLFQNVQGV